MTDTKLNPIFDRELMAESATRIIRNKYGDIYVLEWHNGNVLHNDGKPAHIVYNHNSAYLYYYIDGFKIGEETFYESVRPPIGETVQIINSIKCHYYNDGPIIDVFGTIPNGHSVYRRINGQLVAVNETRY